MAAVGEKYDSVLIGILSNEGEISKFLDKILGFLYRRTDFYRVMKSKDDKMGFPQGVAAQILLKEFRKYEQLALHDEKEREKLSEKAKAEPAPVELKPEPVLPSPAADTPSTAESTSKAQPSPAATTADQDVATENVAMSSTESSADKTSTNTEKGDGDGEDNSEETRQQQTFQANPMSYNGAVREKYVWSQSITDADIRVFVPQYIKKGRQVSVTIDKRHLKVTYTDDAGGKQTPVDEDLTWDINKEESMWSLVPGEHVHISLEKIEERWWEAALAGEPKINVRKIDCSRPITDLDDEAQAKIGEMMYNERQKKLGLPQSHEQKTYDMLKKAWDADGSPFKGQKFDPSVLNVNSGVVTMNQQKNS